MSIHLATFKSFTDFLKRLTDVFRGPSFVAVMKKIDPVFREKILLVVSMANNCAG